MLLLTGEYQLCLDDKNRLSVPSRVRDQIATAEYGSGFYMLLGVNRVLWLYPDVYYERIALAVACLIHREKTILRDHSLENIFRDVTHGISLVFFKNFFIYTISIILSSRTR